MQADQSLLSGGAERFLTAGDRVDSEIAEGQGSTALDHASLGAEPVTLGRRNQVDLELDGQNRTAGGKDRVSGIAASAIGDRAGEFTGMLKKAVEWEAAADMNELEDVQKPIALGWVYHKLKKGSAGWISKTWGYYGKYEVIEIRISEIPKLQNLFGGVPDMEKKMQEDRKKLNDESAKKKAEEKDKKDKVDSLLK